MLNLRLDQCIYFQSDCVDSSSSCCLPLILFFFPSLSPSVVALIAAADLLGNPLNSASRSLANPIMFMLFHGVRVVVYRIEFCFTSHGSGSHSRNTLLSASRRRHLDTLGRRGLGMTSTSHPALTRPPALLYVREEGRVGGREIGSRLLTQSHTLTCYRTTTADA